MMPLRCPFSIRFAFFLGSLIGLTLFVAILLFFVLLLVILFWVFIGGCIYALIKKLKEKINRKKGLKVFYKKVERKKTGSQDVPEEVKQASALSKQSCENCLEKEKRCEQ